MSLLQSLQQSDPVQRSMLLYRRRPYLFLGGGIFLLFLIFLYELSPPTLRARPNFTDNNRAHPYSPSGFNGTWNWQRDGKNFILDEGQCEQAFPGLFDEVKRAVRDRHGKKITLEEVDAIEPVNGYIRGMIYEHELYIISTRGQIYSRELATLHSLHRALVTSPTPLPNIEFTFISDDKNAPHASWSYARRADERVVWLLPDYGFWSWPEPKVGSYIEVQRKAREMESGSPRTDSAYTWARKREQLLWRGAIMQLPLREDFIAKTAGKSWADVKAIEWHNDASMSADLKSMDEHCQYRFLAHTEGNSYSGRLKYLQNCRSVVVAHAMDWIQHQYPLMVKSGPKQNYVEVRRDFGDLEEKIQALIADGAEAERIAENNVRTFRDRYLTPAAEACYWRSLIRGWGSVSFEPEFWTVKDGKKVWRGVPWESYALERRLEWDPY